MGDTVVAVSDFTARAMGMAEDPRLVVAGNGVDVEAIANAQPMPDGPEILFVGRLIDEKRVDLLHRRDGALRESLIDARCAIVGDGPERPGTRRAQRSGCSAGGCRFLGRVPEHEVARHLRAASILVMPSLREGFGMAVAEAQAAGAVPVVVRGPFNGATELVRDDIDGLIVEPRPGCAGAGHRRTPGRPPRLERMAERPWRRAPGGAGISSRNAWRRSTASCLPEAEMRSR